MPLASLLTGVCCHLGGIRLGFLLITAMYIMEGHSSLINNYSSKPTDQYNFVLVGFAFARRRRTKLGSLGLGAGLFGY